MRQTATDAAESAKTESQKMSAYIVEDSTIDKILLALNASRNANGPIYQGLLDSLGVDPESLPSLEAFGRKLLAMNRAAVNQRYNESDAAPYYQFNARPLTCESKREFFVQAYKAACCLDYQCSEGDVPTWPLYKQLEEIQSALACAIVSELPEFKKAVWG